VSGAGLDKMKHRLQSQVRKECLSLYSQSGMIFDEYEFNTHFITFSPFACSFYFFLLSCLVLSCLDFSYLILSYLISSHLILSYHSCHLTPLILTLPSPPLTHTTHQDAYEQSPVGVGLEQLVHSVHVDADGRQHATPAVAKYRSLREFNSTGSSCSPSPPSNGTSTPVDNCST
jgi:hypothetical protein